MEYTESWEMLTLTLMMSASLSSLLTLAEMLVQDWDIWRLELAPGELAGTERESREEVSAGLGLSSAAGAGAGSMSLDKDQRSV